MHLSHIHLASSLACSPAVSLGKLVILVCSSDAMWLLYQTYYGCSTMLLIYVRCFIYGVTKHNHVPIKSTTVLAFSPLAYHAPLNNTDIPTSALSFKQHGVHRRAPHLHGCLLLQFILESDRLQQKGWYFGTSTGTLVPVL